MFIIGKLKNTFSPGMLALTDVGTVTNNGGTLRIDVKRNLYYEYDFVKNDWKLVDDSDLIEATFIPYIKDEIKCDAFDNLTKSVQIQIKWISHHPHHHIRDSISGNQRQQQHGLPTVS